MYGLKKNEKENTYGQRINVELKAIFNVPHIIGIIINQRISRAGLVK